MSGSSHALGATWHRKQHGAIGMKQLELDPRGDRVYHDREYEECGLDRLYRTGRLGLDEDAKRRYDAGMELRELYFSAGVHRRTTSSYQPFGTRGGGDVSDHEAKKRKELRDTMRALPYLASLVLQDTCWFDHPPKCPTGWAILVDALDRLADQRGN